VTVVFCPDLMDCVVFGISGNGTIQLASMEAFKYTGNFVANGCLLIARDCNSNWCE